MQLNNQQLPKLRNDIEIKYGGYDKYNSPTWVIHDYVSEKFYRVGWTEYEILSRWHLGSSEKICNSVNQDTVLNIQDINIQKVLGFLQLYDLIDFNTDNSAEGLYVRYVKTKQGIFKRLLMEYLFFKVPLVYPDSFLNKIKPYINLLFSKWVLYFFVLISISGVYLVTRSWSNFVSQYDYFFTVENLVLLFVVITLTKIIHELAHAFTAKYYGCKVSTMGVAFLVLFPVFYTDTTDSWRLTNRKQRVMIASAGIIAELLLSGLALFLWAVTPDGSFRSLLAYIPSVSLVTTILVNANPLLRFDGYHILSDLLSTDNLQNRSFSLATWKFRKIVFGIQEQQPVICTENDKKMYLIYAYITWIYRFFLYLGIAIVVYYFFFKLLGIFLMLVEIYFFIIQPIIQELLTSVNKISQYKKVPGRAVFSGSVFVLIILILLVPWQSRIKVPAVVTYANESKIYAQHAGKIEKVYIKRGQFVQKKSIILEVGSLEISNRIKKIQNEIDILETKLRQESGQGLKLGQQQVSINQLTEKQNELQSLLDELNKLVIYAPHNGEIINVSKSLKSNTWVNQDDYLLNIADINSKMIVGYILENEMDRLNKDLSKINGIFYANNLRQSPITIKIERLDNSNNKFLSDPYFASLYGGELLVFYNDNKLKKRSQYGEELILNDAVYKITARPVNRSDILPDYSVRGTLYIYGERRSIVTRIWRYALSVFLRETGF